MPHTQKIVDAEIERSRCKRDAEREQSKERVSVTDQTALLNLDPRRILTGEVEIFDDRDGTPCRG